MGFVAWYLVTVRVGVLYCLQGAHPPPNPPSPPKQTPPTLQAPARYCRLPLMSGVFWIVSKCSIAGWCRGRNPGICSVAFFSTCIDVSPGAAAYVQITYGHVRAQKRMDICGAPKRSAIFLLLNLALKLVLSLRRHFSPVNSEPVR